MTGRRHFHRLEQIYTTTSTEARETHDVALALGHAELSARLDTDRLGPQGIANHTHYRATLADAASLAAGSLVEDRVVMAEQFDMHVLRPGYSGAVTASARVTLAQPPRYHVGVQLANEAGEVIAHGSGVFVPTTVALPSDSDPEDASPREQRPEPAVYATVWSTPFGVLHLN